MKKIIPVLLIILIVLNTFGFNLLLDYLILKCKYDFSKKGHYDLEQVILLKITGDEAKEFQRIDENEIRYKGKMYDIIKETQKNNILYINCISDKNEDNLFEILFKINKQDSPNSKSEPLYTKNLLIKNYILNENDIIHYNRNDKRLYIYLIQSYNSPVEEIILPPPELV
ncbi:MAG: hypothetical protein P8Z35_19730 [Ignavibacteriaceae bacterium]